jgi:translocation and assembly module TamA
MINKACRCIITLLVLSIYPVLAQANDAFRIEISGIQGEMYNNVQAQLSIEEKKSDSDISVLKMDKFLKKAPAIIRKSLEPYGYFKATVSPANIRHVDSTLVAAFRVNPGQPLKLSSVTVQILGNGESNPALHRLAEDFPIKTGMVFNSDAYEKARDLLFQTANDEGYIKSYFIKNEVKVDLKRYRADVTLILQTEDRYYFGKVSYSQSPYAQSFLDRFQSFKSVTHFSSKKLYQFQQEMSNSGYFQQVEATPDLEHIENHQVPINVDVMAPKSQRYDFGLGYGTFTGPRLSAGVNFRRLTDTGQHFNAEMKLSSVLSGLAAKYFIPGRNPLTDQYVIGANYQKFTPKNGRSYANNLSLGYIKKSGHWHNSITLNYLTERYSIENQPSTNSELLYPSLNLSYVKADDILNPHNGHSLSLTLQGATRDLLSSTSFLQGELKGKYIFSPFDSSRVILRGDLGYTVVNNIDNLPLTLRYFAGGLNSIRGYPDSSIGPGKYLVTGSAEYQHRIWGNWYGALFYDAGTASDHYGDPPLSIGDGAGIVYQSVVGPIKIYLGRAENKRGKPFSVEFNVGPEF